MKEQGSRFGVTVDKGLIMFQGALSFRCRRGRDQPDVVYAVFDCATTSR